MANEQVGMTDSTLIGIFKKYTDNAVANVKEKFEVVASYEDLPAVGDGKTIYLVPTGSNNVYDQYIYDTNTSSYVDIGDTTIDLDEYVTDTELEGALSPIIDITGNFVVENGKLCIIVDDGNNNNATTNEALALDSTLQELVDAVEDIADNVSQVAEASAAEAAKDWMDENVTPVGSAVVVDSSLTIQGAAADAKKTGDEISSVKSALTSLLNYGLLPVHQTWLAGLTSGNVNSSLNIVTSGTWGTQNKYIVITPTKDFILDIKSASHNVDVRTVDANDIVTSLYQLTTIRKAMFVKGLKYAISIKGSTDISSVDGNSLVNWFDIEYNVMNRIMVSDAILSGRNSGQVQYVAEWERGLYNANVGQTVTFDAGRANNTKALIIDTKSTITIRPKSGYKVNTFLVVNSANVVLKKQQNIYNPFCAPAGRYIINVSGSVGNENIRDTDINDICIVKQVLFDSGYKVYPYDAKIEPTNIYQGDTTRRTQGGCVNGDYIYIAQPATDESQATTITKINKNTGALVLSVTTDSYGHAGNLTYNTASDKLIVIDYQSANSRTAVYTLDPSTLALEDTDYIPFRIWGMCYDKTDGNYFASLYDSFGMFNYMTVIKIKASDLSVIEADPIPFEQVLDGQGISTDGYYLYSPYDKYYSTAQGLKFHSGIGIYDLTGKMVGYHTINTDLEIQWCDFDASGVMYSAFDPEARVSRMERKSKWEY